MLSALRPAWRTSSLCEPRRYYLSFGSNHYSRDGCPESLSGEFDQCKDG
jgi:hypothetical protein